MIKLNLGSHNKTIDDKTINVDILELENVDATCDLNIVPFKLTIKSPRKFLLINSEWDLFEDQLLGNVVISIEKNRIDEITMIEVLEHLSFHNTRNVLSEIHRILKPGGILKLQVPDCGKAMKLWVENKLCECVPQKDLDNKGIEFFKASPTCSRCHGTAEMNPMRWLLSFTGAQKHEYDSHNAIFTKDILEFELKMAGFKNYEFTNHSFKLQVKVTK